MIFLCYGWCTSFFITDDIIPAITRTGLYNLLADIQSIGCYYNRKPRKTLFYPFGQSDKCLAFTILLYFFFTLIDILLRIFSWLFPILCSFFFLCDKVFLLFYLIAKKSTCFLALLVRIIFTFQK